MIVTEKQLDETDKRILAYLFEGKTAKEIGKSIFMSPRTVEGRLKKIRDYHDCKNNVQLVVKLLSNLDFRKILKISAIQ